MSVQRKRLTIGLLSLLVAVAFLVGIGWGAVSIPPAQVVGIIMSRLGFETDIPFSAQQEAVLFAIRLPRVLMALIVGSALAVSGAVLQGVFRNPLAEPVLLGIATGATTGAVIAIALGIASIGAWSLPPAAFVGGLVTTLGLQRFAQRQGRTDVTTLVLSGVAMNLFLGAVISLVTAMSKVPGLRDVTFWTLGGLGGTLWSHFHLAAPVVVMTVIFLWRLGARLDLLLLGETEAQHLGVDTRALRNQAIAWVALSTGTAVAFAGSIAFVGLVVPHAVRMIVGPNHRILIPASALGGAALVGFGDSLARNIIAPMELPIGVLMTLVGGPVFFYLLDRSRKQGAW